MVAMVSLLVRGWAMDNSDEALGLFVAGDVGPVGCSVHVSECRLAAVHMQLGAG
jgi:hypothetical protein